MALDATAKRRIKNRKLAKSLIAQEPVLDWKSKEDQEAGLGYVLSWYSQNANKKDMKKYALEYYKTRDKSVHDRLKDLEEWRFGTFGSLCRMMMHENGYRHEWSTSQFYHNKLQELLQVYEHQKVEIEARKAKEAEENKSKPKPLTIQERIFYAAQEVGAEYDYEIDKFTTEKNFIADFSAKGYLSQQGVSATVAAKVVEFFLPVEQELKDAYAGKDEQLVEGYNHITRKQLKAFRDFVSMLVSETRQYAQSVKKPIRRKTRVVPPQRRIARLKYQSEFKELELRSISPIKILDSFEIWIYNTKYKKIQCYVSDGTPLDVKGTTIVGFDVNKSQQWTLRKPEVFFKGLTIGKRAMSNAIKTIKTKPAAVNGRVNENCILLGAF